MMKKIIKSIFAVTYMLFLFGIQGACIAAEQITPLSPLETSTTPETSAPITLDLNPLLPNAEALEKVRNSIVSIDTRIAISAYDNSGAWMGTGFIADKQKGIIVTNNHVVSSGGIGNYIVTFNNGRQTEAKLIYYDLWQDYAFLKVDVNEMPESTTQINFSSTKPKLNQKVFIIGNTEGKEFSFHDGYISSLHEITGQMPQASYIINLNSTGGSSGSPLMDSETNQALGIIYGGGGTYSLALNGEYVKSSLDLMTKDIVPSRKHIGVITDLYSLDKAVKHRSFPKKIMEEYVKKFPDTRNKVVVVIRTLAKSPAENILKPGDIIWEINGQEIAGDLYIMDSAMNKLDKNVTLTIYREGEKLTKEIPLYDINKNKVEKMLEFAGAIIFESDDLFTSKTGIPLKSLTIKNVKNGSAFSDLPTSFNYDSKNHYRIVISSINKYPVNNLEELQKILPELTKQKYLNIKFKNYQPYYPHFSYSDRMFISSHDERISDFNLDTTDSMPRVLKFNYAKKEWEVEKAN